MHTDEKKFATVAKPAAEALRSGSELIVDLLLSLPEHVAEADDAVDRAIARRLQMELADRMRSLIGDEDQPCAA